jgi:hypothetical protein
MVTEWKRVCFGLFSYLTFGLAAFTNGIRVFFGRRKDVDMEYKYHMS